MTDPANQNGFIQNTVEENQAENTPGNFAGRGFAVSNTSRLKRAFPGSPIYSQQNEALLDEEYRRQQRTNNETDADGNLINDAPSAQAYYGFANPQDTAADFNITSVAFIPQVSSHEPALGRSRFSTIGAGTMGVSHIRSGSMERYQAALNSEPNSGIIIPTPSSDSRLEFYPESWNELARRGDINPDEQGVSREDLVMQNKIVTNDRSNAQSYYNYSHPTRVDLSYSFAAENIENDTLGSYTPSQGDGPTDTDLETLSNHMRTPILDTYNESPAFASPEPIAQLSNVNIGTVQGGIESAPEFGSFTGVHDYIPFLQLLEPIAAEKMGFAQYYYRFNSADKLDLRFSAAPDLSAFDDLEANEYTDSNGNAIYSRFIPNPKPPENFNPTQDNQDLIDIRPLQAISPILVQNPSNTSAEIKERALTIFFTALTEVER